MVQMELTMMTNRTIKKLFMVVLLLTFFFTSLSITGCKQNENQPSEKTLSLLQSSIPENFIKYNDKSAQYSISYPSAWQIAKNYDELNVLINEIATKQLELKPLNSTLIFLAGKENNGAYLPSANIVVGPITNQNNFEVNFNAMVGGFEKKVPEFILYNRAILELDGQEIGILDYEAQFIQNPEKLRYLFLITQQKDVIWGITCACRPGSWNENEVDFYHIISSFKVLN
jgi:hypothetical protein